MDDMENKGQRMVDSPTKSRFPSAPQHTQGQSGRMLGIQDQGMVVKGGHSYHEDQEVLRMLGEKLRRMYLQEPRSHLRRRYRHHNTMFTMSGKMHIQSTWKTMKSYTGWAQNQDSWGPSDLRGHTRRGMTPAILQRDQWEWSFVTECVCFIDNQT